MAESIGKMIAADTIVLATPVYFYTMDAQLKTFIDRTVSNYRDISGKEFYYIITAADNSRASLGKTIDGIRGFTLDCLPGSEEKGILYGTGLWKEGATDGTGYLDEAYEMGKNV